MIQIFDNVEKTDRMGRVLKTAKKAVVTAEINGQYTLTLDVAEPVKPWQMLKADTPEGLQAFYVSEIEGDSEVKSITAKHVSGLLGHLYAPPLALDKASIQTVGAKIAELLQNNPLSLPFTLTVAPDIDLGLHSIDTQATSMMDLLQGDDTSISGTWDTKIYRDNFDLLLGGRDGVPTEILLAERKNLLEFSAGIRIKEVATRLHLHTTVYVDGTEYTEGYDKDLSVVVDSPLIGRYPFVLERAVEVTDEDIDTVEKLRAYGQRLFEVEGIDKPKESLTLTAIPTAGQSLRLGNSCLIYYQDEGVYSRTTLISYEYDPIAKEFLSMSFGELPRNLRREIARKIKSTTGSMYSTAKTAVKKAKNNVKKIKHAKSTLQNELATDRKLWQSEIKETKTHIDGAKEELRTLIKQTAEEIKLEASRRYATTTEVASLSVKADRIESKVESVEQTADGAWTKASRVEQTASGIISEVREVRSTANSALSTANSAWNRASQLVQTVDDFRFKLGTVDHLTQVFGVYDYGVSVNGTLVVRGDIDCGGGVSAYAFSQKGAGE